MTEGRRGSGAQAVREPSPFPFFSSAFLSKLLPLLPQREIPTFQHQFAFLLAGRKRSRKVTHPSFLGHFPRAFPFACCRLELSDITTPGWRGAWEPVCYGSRESNQYPVEKEGRYLGKSISLPQQRVFIHGNSGFTAGGRVMGKEQETARLGDENTQGFQR